MRQRSAFILAVCMAFAFRGAPSNAQALNEVPPQRLALLAHGINFNNWFSPWANPASYATAFGPKEAAFLKKAGFTVCRLPLDPDLLFDASDLSTPKPVIISVDHAVRLLLNAGLAVILDPIHGSSETDEWEKGLDHDPAFLGKVETYWETLAGHFAAISADRIFFEVMNEPHLSARENVDPAWWQPVQRSLVAAIRRGAPSSTIIVTGERWGGIDGLLELKPLEDRNVVYSFHWYDPFTFTHQGATWTGPILEAQALGHPRPSSPGSGCLCRRNSRSKGTRPGHPLRDRRLGRGACARRAGTGSGVGRGQPRCRFSAGSSACTARWLPLPTGFAG